MPLPQFIEQHGNPQIPPPYSFPNVQIHSFTLPAYTSVLEALCRKYLNFGMTYDQAIDEHGFGYRPFGPMVDLDVLIYPYMYSESELGFPKYRDRGFVSQHELYFRVWVTKWIKTLGIPHPTGEVEMFIPYIFVDDPWSVITGRDVVGYPKILATFDGITNDLSSTRMTMRTRVFKDYDRAKGLTEELVVEIVLPDDPIDPNLPIDIPELTWPWGQVNSVFDLNQLDDLLFVGLLDSLGGQSFRTIQLKQFRDAETPGLACHQSLLQGELKVKRGAFSFLRPAKITIHKYASLRVAEELGLEEGELTSINQSTQTCELMELDNFINLLV